MGEQQGEYFDSLHALPSPCNAHNLCQNGAGDTPGPAGDGERDQQHPQSHQLARGHPLSPRGCRAAAPPSQMCILGLGDAACAVGTGSDGTKLSLHVAISCSRDFFYILSVTFYQHSVPPVMPEMTNYFKPEAIQIPQGFSLNPQLLRRLHTTLLARNPPSLTHEVPSSTFSGFSG